MDRSSAALLALLLVAISIAVLVDRAARPGQRHHSSPRQRRQPARAASRLGRARIPAVLFCALVVGFALVLPITILAAWLLRSIGAGADLSGLGAAAIHSLTLGGWTALIATVCALPIAILLVRFPGSGARSVERLAYLGYALPGSGRRTGLRRVWRGHALLPDAGHAGGGVRGPLPARGDQLDAGGTPAGQSASGGSGARVGPQLRLARWPASPFPWRDQAFWPERRSCC